MYLSCRGVPVAGVYAAAMAGTRRRRLLGPRQWHDRRRPAHSPRAGRFVCQQSAAPVRAPVFGRGNRLPVAAEKGRGDAQHPLTSANCR